MLIENYCEKNIRFAGIVQNINPDLDASSRSAVLTAVDHGKKVRQIPNITAQDHEAIIYADPYNIKLSTSDGNEELLLRVPIHQIEAVSYLWADKQHMIVIKFGGADTFERNDLTKAQSCYLAVLYCESREAAEELCAAVEQYFQQAYTEATMTYFDRTVREGAGEGATGGAYSETSSIQGNFQPITHQNHSRPRHSLDAERSLSPNPIKRGIAEQSSDLGFLSRSMSNLMIAGGTLSSSSVYSQQSASQRSRVSSGSSDLSTAAADLILEYMTKLQHKLTTDELKEFAQLMKSWQSHNMPIATFCGKVLDLYGFERKHLLADMKPFIPTKDLEYFQHFLEKRVYTEDSRDRLDDFEVINLPISRTRPKLGHMMTPWQTESIDHDVLTEYGVTSSDGANKELCMRESITMNHNDSSSDSS